MRRNPYDQERLGLAAHALQPSGRVVINLHDDDEIDSADAAAAERARMDKAVRQKAWREYKVRQARERAPGVTVRQALKWKV